MHRRISNVLVALVILAGAALAHDPRLHQANAYTGEVTAVGSGSFDLKTKTGNWKVTYSATTTFEHGKAKVDKSHLKKGDTVGVIGTKLPNGELVAKQVLLGVEEEADHKH
jgi:fructose-specific component phosphotransferase system IIB-like protein